MEAYTGKFTSRRRESHLAKAIQPRNIVVQVRTVFALRNSIWAVPLKVRRRPACRGLRAWRVNKTPFGSTEARQSPAALTTRAKRVGKSNDKKDGPKE